MSVFSLKGKTAIVTGGAAGIGAAIVERFKAEGTKVVIFDLKGSPSVDITDYDAVKKAVEAAGPVDILVNNAALYAGLGRKRFDMVFKLNGYICPDLRITRAFQAAWVSLIANH